MEFKVALDRIEKDKAILLSETTQRTYIVSLELLPEEVREGDILSISIKIDQNTTERRKEEVTDLIDKLSRKDKKQKR